MKKLYIIGGTMGVGKTTVCHILKKKLENCVFLDGDWCWDMEPFRVNQETKKMVMENISFLLNQFIHCSVYENIIFCWVLHEQSIIDELLACLNVSECRLVIVSLLCSRERLTERLEKDVAVGIRTEDVIARSIERIPLYETLPTIKIDVSDLPPEQVAEFIAEL